MRSLTLSRGEKLSPSRPHSLNVPWTHSKPIVKSTGRRCAERKAERGGSWRRCDFLISTFRPGPPSSFSLRDRSLLHYPTRHWSSSGWMNRVYAISGTSRLPWMGAALSHSGPAKKKGSRPVFTSCRLPRMGQHKCAIVRPGPGPFESARDLAHCRTAP